MSKRSFLQTKLSRWQPSESIVLGGIAVLVGLAGGAGVWLFHQLIEVSHTVLFDTVGGVLNPLGGWTVLLMPVLGGLVVGLLVHFFVGVERHHGVGGVMEAVALAGGRLRYRRIPLKTAAAAVSIGSGASVGPEDPSVQIGANLGSMFGQKLRLSDDRIRALAAAGAAAGVAAAFNAPIAGVFFALEIILGEIGGRTFGVVVLAAVVSSVFTQAVSGTRPAFDVPSYAFHSAWELPLYLGLGLLAGPVAALYSRLLYMAHDFFDRLRVQRWLKPVLAGFAVGLVGLVLPQVLGVGYETIEGLLNGERLAIGLVIALLAAKLILTPVCIGAGFLGGVFAPSLFLGATLGAAYGFLIEGLFPALAIAPAAFAMVGMAAVLAGAVHAPLTAILLLFEMTNDYRIILPLMFSVVVSLLVSQRLQRESIYSLGLARKGVRIQRGRDVEVLEALTVGEVMQREAPTLRESDTLGEATEKLMKLHYHGLPVLDEKGDLVGVLTVQDIDRTQAEESVGPRERTVGDACTRDLLVAHPVETLGSALRRMSVRDIGRLPVVPHDQPKRLLGVLRRTDVVRAYDAALTRRAALRHRAHQVRLGESAGVSVTEFVVEGGSACAGRSVGEVSWPRDSVLATLRRGSQVLIPRGETILQKGDLLTVVADGEAREAVSHLCRSQ